MKSLEKLTVGEIAKLLGINASALRYYEARGLLTPDHTDPWTGYRKFNPRQLYLLNFIKAMTDLNVPLKVLKQMIETEDSGFIPQALEQRRTQLEKEIRKLQSHAARLSETLAHWEDPPQPLSEEPQWRTLPEAWYLETEEPEGYSFAGYAAARTRLFRGAEKNGLEFRDEQTAVFPLTPGAPFWESTPVYRLPLKEKTDKVMRLPGLRVVKEGPLKVQEIPVKGPVSQLGERGEALRRDWNPVWAPAQELRLIHLRGTNTTPRAEDFLTLIQLRG